MIMCLLIGFRIGQKLGVVLLFVFLVLISD